MLVRLGISEWQKWSCALGLTGLQCTKLSYPIATEVVPLPLHMTGQHHPLHNRHRRAISAALDKQQLEHCSPELNIWSSSSAQGLLLVLIAWLLRVHTTLLLHLLPPHSYPWSGGKIQQLISWSEPWCSAGGKGYQTAGILARLTRLCTFRLSVKTQLCLLSFHIPKQRRQ